MTSSVFLTSSWTWTVWFCSTVFLAFGLRAPVETRTPIINAAKKTEINLINLKVGCIVENNKKCVQYGNGIISIKCNFFC